MARGRPRDSPLRDDANGRVQCLSACTAPNVAERSSTATCARSAMAQRGPATRPIRRRHSRTPISWPPRPTTTCAKPFPMGERHHDVGLVGRAWRTPPTGGGRLHRGLPPRVGPRPGRYSRRTTGVGRRRARNRDLCARVRAMSWRARCRRTLRSYRQSAARLERQRRLLALCNTQRQSGNRDAELRGALGDGEIEDVVALLRTYRRPPPPHRSTPVHPPPIPLGPVPLNPKGPEPVGFHLSPATTSVDVVKAAARSRRSDGRARCASSVRLCHRTRRRSGQRTVLRSQSVPFATPEERMARLLLLVPARRIGTASAEARRGRFHQGDRTR